MAGNKDIPRIKNPPSGDGHHVTYRYMTATELAEQDARGKAYEAMLARQDAFERSRQVSRKSRGPAVERYDKLGNHLGEFDHLTGKRTKDAKPGRKTPK